MYLIDFAWFLPKANFVRGAFEDFPVSEKILKKERQTIRIICLALMMTENLSQLLNTFFANEKIRPYLFNRFLNTLVGFCLLYTSPSPRDGLLSRMPSSA